MTKETVKESVTPIVAKDALASGGLISGVAAFIGASCCVLPLILVNIGLGGAWIANLAFFAVAKPYFLTASALFIALAFVVAYRGNRKPSTKTMVILGTATGLTAIAYVMPWYEGRVLRFLFG